MWIFCLLFLGIFPRGNFPQNFKMQFNDIGRVPDVRKQPSDDLMSCFGESKCLQVWGNFSFISTVIKKFPLNFRVDSCFTYNRNYRVDSLHQQPPSLGIPLRICKILPTLGQKRLRIQEKRCDVQGGVLNTSAHMMHFLMKMPSCVLNVMLFKLFFLSTFFGHRTTGGHHKPMFVQ